VSSATDDPDAFERFHGRVDRLGYPRRVKTVIATFLGLRNALMVSLSLSQLPCEPATFAYPDRQPS
jgi:hypothetical protein